MDPVSWSSLLLLKEVGAVYERIGILDIWSDRCDRIDPPSLVETIKLQ
jgi:hypothetical protein